MHTVLAMISRSEGIALIVLPLAAALFYKRLRSARTAWSPEACLIAGILAALGLIFLLSLICAVLWPGLAHIEF
jgi:hypothetical protein